MSTTFSTNRKFERMFVNILSILFILAMALPATGSASAQESNPRMVVSITYDWFRAEQFTPAASLHVRVYDKQGGIVLWEDNRTADGSGFIFVGEWEHPVDLRPGNYISISDGSTTKDLVLEAVTLDVFDPFGDYLSGTAPAGRLVWVGVGNENSGCGMDVIAEAVTGAWTANFSTQPCDVTEDMWAAAQVFDEDGDASEANPPPTAIFTVFPEWDAVEGWAWPQDTTVHLEIEDPNTEQSPDYSQDQPVVPTPWNPNDVWVRFDFAGAYDVKPGDVVTLSNEVSMQTHEVQNLAVKQVEIRDDAIYGTADTGAVVHAWVHEHGETEMVITAGGDGTWMANFGTTGFNLLEGMCGRSEIRDEGGNATAVDWCYPVPHFTAFPEWDYIEGFDWHPNDYVYLSIDQESPEPVTFYTQARTELTPWNPDSWWVRFELNGQFDLKPGDFLTLDDDSVTRTMIVRKLAVTNVDPVTNVVGGTADPGTVVQVWPHETGEQLQAEANASGAWQVDFSGMFDLVPGTCGRSQIVDGFDNATAVDWCAPKPWLIAFPENDAVEGWEWPEGATVTLTINNAPGLEWSGTAAVTTWGDPRTYVRIEFATDYNLQIGDEVTLTDEFGTTRTHTVQNLAVTKTDPEDNVIKGTADLGAEVYVWPHTTGQQQLAITASSGKWSADFSEIYDLLPGEGGRAEIRDEMGNSTAVDWYIPYPRFTVYPDAQWFDGLDWPDGATVTITVKDKPECTLTKESWGGFFNGGFPEGCIVTAGDKVTFTDGITTRKHTVQNLAIITVDKDANIVAGIAETGAVVHTWVWELEGSNLEVIAMDGTWQADFGALGIDLVVGMGIQAEIRDANGNATSVDLPVPDPRIVASITEDWFYLVDFIPGARLDLSIYENQGGSPVWHGKRTADVNGFAWIDAEGWDLIPGNYLIVSDGNTTKDLVIEGFTFDVFDLTNGHLQGAAPEPFGRAVWVGIGWENDGWSMDVTTDGTGSWIADFGQPVPSDYDWVAAQIFDSDGDASELRPASQIMFLRPRCGTTYTAQAGSLLEIQYGSWLAFGEDLAKQNAEHLTVNLVLNDETVTGVQQPVVPGSEIPCGALDDTYGMFYVAQVGPLSAGSYVARVTWIFDIPVTDGYDANGDGEPDWYGPGEVFTHEFTIIVE